jgi:hypothetical protein
VDANFLTKGYQTIPSDTEGFKDFAIGEAVTYEDIRA